MPGLSRRVGGEPVTGDTFALTVDANNGTRDCGRMRAGCAGQVAETDSFGKKLTARGWSGRT